MGATMAAGTSCATATTAASVVPPRPNAYTRTAMYVAHSATLNAANAISARRIVRSDKALLRARADSPIPPCPRPTSGAWHGGFTEGMADCHGRFDRREDLSTGPPTLAADRSPSGGGGLSAARR